MERNKLFRCIICLCFCLLAAPQLKAQDTLGTDVVNIIKAFKPTLSDAIKVKVLPNPEIPVFKAPDISYKNVPGLQLALKPVYTPMKPVTIGTSNPFAKLKNNYTKLGFGNYGSPVAEFYMNSLRSRSYNANIFYKHYSASGDKDFNNFSDNHAGAELKRFFKKSTLSIQSGFQRNAYRYFGIPDSLTDNVGNIKVTPGRVILNTLNLQGRVNNVQRDSASFRYDVGINYYGFFTSNMYNENDVMLDGTFSKLFAGEHLVELYTGLNSVANSLTYNRTYFRFNPRYNLSIENKFHIKAGFNSTYFSNDRNENKFYFYPVADARYEVIDQKLIAFTGITGDVQKNTDRTVLGENRFADAKGYYRNTLNKFEFNAGLKGNFSAKTGFMARYRARKMSDMIFYVNDFTYGKPNGYIFTPVQANANISQLTAELNYQYSERMRLAVVGNLYGYHTQRFFVNGIPVNSVSDKAPQMPKSDLRLNGTYNIGDKFLLKADLFYMNQRYSLLVDPALPGPTKYQYNKMKGLLDMNVGIDYRYSKFVSLFLDVNNLSANRYQRWYSYPVYGFNVHGGLTFTF